MDIWTGYHIFVSPAPDDRPSTVRVALANLIERAKVGRMRARGHAKLLAVVTLAWAIFWVAGLPAYYQQYSFLFMVVFDALVLVPFSFFLFRVLARARPQRRMSLSLWLAFYISVPLCLYDYLYCGVYLGHGWTFLATYWYLSVYYAIPWLVGPAIGYWLNRRDATSRRHGRG